MKRLIPLLVLTILLIAGCRAHERVWPGQNPDSVWSALVAAANEPRYENWDVEENNVWSDEETGRIEIHRKLQRFTPRHDTGYDVRYEDREYRMQVMFNRADPPTATFRANDATVPVWVRWEANNYWDHVDMLLGLTPME